MHKFHLAYPKNHIHTSHKEPILPHNHFWLKNHIQEIPFEAPYGYKSHH